MPSPLCYSLLLWVLSSNLCAPTSLSLHSWTGEMNVGGQGATLQWDAGSRYDHRRRRRRTLGCHGRREEL